MKRLQKPSKQDFISELTDTLLIHILSLLPEPDANRTRVLSKRWKNLYAFLPNLRFVLSASWPMGQVIRFYDSINQTLAIRHDIPIRRFFLDSSKNCESAFLHRCLSNVFRLQVKELCVRLPNNMFWVFIKFDCELVRRCNTLVELNLTGGFELILPELGEFVFPSLTKLVLVNVVYSSEGFTNLISASPVLEELVVERRIFGKYFRRGKYTYMVCSQSLKRLTMCLSSVSDYKVVIDAPELEYLNISDHTNTTYVLTESLSLVEAHICYDSRDAHQLLTRLSAAKVLTLTNTTTQALYNYPRVDMLMLHNLVKLVIGIDCIWYRDLLMELLNTMPNLEHITFSDGIAGNRLLCRPWNPPTNDPPACLCSKMKEIVIHNGEALRQEELPFIKYLLKHCCKLEKLAIIAHIIDSKKREQLLNFNRGSMCQIELLQRKMSTLKK